MKDIQVASEIYEIAQSEIQKELDATRAELERVRGEMDAIRDESQAIGVLKALEFQAAMNELLKYTVLQRVKDEKSYRQGGLTWKSFVEGLGFSQRSVDQVLSDLSPVVGKFSANFAEISGLPFNKIRQLGKAVSAKSAELAENTVIIDGEEIPLTPDHKDEIEDAIDRIRTSAKKETNDLQEQLTAKNRASKALHESLAKYEKSLARYEAPLAKSDATPEEVRLRAEMEKIRNVFDGLIAGVDTSAEKVVKQWQVSARISGELVALLSYMVNTCEAIRDTAEEVLWLPDDPEADEDGMMTTTGSSRRNKWVQPARIAEGKA